MAQCKGLKNSAITPPTYSLEEPREVSTGLVTGSGCVGGPPFIHGSEIASHLDKSVAATQRQNQGEHDQPMKYAEVSHCRTPMAASLPLRTVSKKPQTCPQSHGDALRDAQISGYELTHV